MKKLLAMVMVLMLFAVAAYAEARTREIEVEGMKEMINEERAEGNGYALYYDVDRFAFYANGVGEGVDLLVPSSDSAVSPVYLQIRRAEGDPAAEYIADGFADEGEVQLGDAGAPGLTARRLTASRSGVSYTAYLIPDGDGMFVLDIACAVEASEGFGARLRAAVNTFELVEPAPEA
ncbi:MAG: hypothetical protein GX647_08190 [Clostridiales bacterium]|mgnify:CR=1 FL=1|jgi:hypothetical protein|nr:hypothetical protein [Clostridiales bacterium]